MPTAIVYVDGFNLYKGQLESRPENKWLDLVAMFDEVLSDYEVLHVHYFTARIKGRMNPEDPQAPDRQDAYIRALRTLERITVRLGPGLSHPDRHVTLRSEGRDRLSTRRPDKALRTQWRVLLPVPATVVRGAESDA